MYSVFAFRHSPHSSLTQKLSLGSSHNLHAFSLRCLMPFLSLSSFSYFLVHSFTYTHTLTHSLLVPFLSAFILVLVLRILIASSFPLFPLDAAKSFGCSSLFLPLLSPAFPIHTFSLPNYVRKCTVTDLPAS